MKNLVHMSGFPASKASQPAFIALVDTVKTAEKNIVAANGKDGLQMCAIGPMTLTSPSWIRWCPVK